jgi:hypothetical protein
MVSITLFTSEEHKAIWGTLSTVVFSGRLVLRPFPQLLRSFSQGQMPNHTGMVPLLALTSSLFDWGARTLLLSGTVGSAGPLYCRQEGCKTAGRRDASLQAVRVMRPACWLWANRSLGNWCRQGNQDFRQWQFWGLLSRRGVQESSAVALQAWWKQAFV